MQWSVDKDADMITNWGGGAGAWSRIFKIMKHRTKDYWSYRPMRLKSSFYITFFWEHDSGQLTWLDRSWNSQCPSQQWCLWYFFMFQYENFVAYYQEINKINPLCIAGLHHCEQCKTVEFCHRKAKGFRCMAVKLQNIMYCWTKYIYLLSSSCKVPNIFGSM
jgi:hypothetical protein